MSSIILLTHITIGIILLGYSLVSVLQSTASRVALKRISYLLSGSVISGLGLALSSSSVNLLAVCRNLLPYLIIVAIVSWLHVRKDQTLQSSDFFSSYREATLSLVFVVAGLALGF